MKFVLLIEVIIREPFSFGKSVFPYFRSKKHKSVSSITSNKYMLFTGWEVRIGRNCARGLEYRLRP